MGDLRGGMERGLIARADYQPVAAHPFPLFTVSRFHESDKRVAIRVRGAKAIKRCYRDTHPHLVELPELPGGYGRKLNAIYTWCRENIPDHRAIGGTFFFNTEDEAEGFRRTWLEPEA